MYPYTQCLEFSFEKRFVRQEKEDKDPVLLFFLYIYITVLSSDKLRRSFIK